MLDEAIISDTREKVKAIACENEIKDCMQI